MEKPMFENFFSKKVDKPAKATFPRTKLASLQGSRHVYGSPGIDDGMKGYHNSTLEPLTELLAPTGLLIYNKMRKNDPIIGGLMLLLSTVVRRMDCYIDGPNAKTVTEILDQMSTPFTQILDEISSAFTYGYYLGEKIWQMKSGTMLLTDIEPRLQSTIDSINDDFGLVNQMSAGGPYSTPYEKTLHVVLMSENRSPFGISMLRHLYKPYYYKISIEAAEALAIDRDLGGLPVLKAPEGFDFTAADSGSPNYDANVAATLEWAIQLVSSVRRDQQQGVVIPAGWDLTILRGENRASVPTSDIIARYNTEMATGILANFLSLGAFATTNNSNSQMHVTNFLGACDAYAKTIADAFQKQVIYDICRYNRIGKEPTIHFAIKNYNSLRDVGTFLSSLIEKGAVQPTESIEKAILALSNLPYNKEEAEKAKEEAEKKAKAIAKKPAVDEGGEDA